jgi:hypothetical protein
MSTSRDSVELLCSIIYKFIAPVYPDNKCQIPHSASLFGSKRNLVTSFRRCYADFSQIKMLEKTVFTSNLEEDLSGGEIQAEAPPPRNFNLPMESLSGIPMKICILIPVLHVLILKEFSTVL